MSETKATDGWPRRVYTDEDRRRFRHHVALLESTAYHEAGHAVAGLALGAPVEGMHVVYWEDDREIAGQVQVINLGWEREEIVDLTIDAAGEVAEKIAGFRKRYSFRGRPSNGRRADGERLHDSELRHEAIRRAEQILTDRWHEVEALAETLLEMVGQCGVANIGGRESIQVAMESGRKRPEERFGRIVAADEGRP